MVFYTHGIDRSDFTFRRTILFERMHTSRVIVVFKNEKTHLY